MTQLRNLIFKNGALYDATLMTIRSTREQRIHRLMFCARLKMERFIKGQRFLPQNS